MGTMHRRALGTGLTMALVIGTVGLGGSGAGGATDVADAAPVRSAQADDGDQYDERCASPIKDTMGEDGGIFGLRIVRSFLRAPAKKAPKLNACVGEGSEEPTADGGLPCPSPWSVQAGVDQTWSPSANFEIGVELSYRGSPEAIPTQTCIETGKQPGLFFFRTCFGVLGAAQEDRVDPDQLPLLGDCVAVGLNRVTTKTPSWGLDELYDWCTPGRTDRVRYDYSYLAVGFTFGTDVDDSSSDSYGCLKKTTDVGAPTYAFAECAPDSSDGVTCVKALLPKIRYRPVRNAFLDLEDIFRDAGEGGTSENTPTGNTPGRQPSGRQPTGTTTTTKPYTTTTTTDPYHTTTTTFGGTTTTL